MYAQINIISNFASIGMYCAVGCEVEIISFSDPVYICEYMGKRFPCHKGKLGPDMPVVEEEVKAILPQLTLF